MSENPRSNRSLEGAELPWRDWVRRKFPAVCTAPFAQRHVDLWEWFDALAPGVASKSAVKIWPRGGGKSSSAEMGIAWTGVKLSRRFVLYVCETQPQADKHVQSISTLFEMLGVGRDVNRYGASKGWRRDQLRTENGFNVAGIGADVAGRGVKLDQFRPDLILFDDIDSRHDTELTRTKKISTITDSLIPAGSSDCAVLFLQNLIYADSIVSQLADGRADFLHGREVSRVERAVEGLQVEQRMQADGMPRYFITGGVPTWAGQNLTTCEAQLNAMGLRAFLREMQQEVHEEEGGLWKREQIDAGRVTSHPALVRICVSVDPNASEGGDEAGIMVAGVASVNGVLHGYLIEDATTSGGPKAWAEAAVTAYNKHHADVMVAEKNNGGDMVKITIQTVPGAPPVKLVHASRGKITRAEPVQKLFEDGRFHLVGRFAALEKELCSYKAGMPSPNRMDSLVWCATELMLAPPTVYNVRIG